ncbi:MAG: PHP domain-containing protein [Bacteroidetes bacterium]|nr:PHP domain-containing protein [Bacteroidota bacterium]
MKIDFHTHTHHSYDSLMKPREILRIAKKRGLDGIVICDHNTIKGGVEAAQVNTDSNFTVIIGAEIATNAGDITGIFLNKEIISRNFDEVVAEIKAQKGKVILNHPYKGHDLTKIDYSKIDFIEGYNSRLSKKDNDKALELAKEHGIPILAGSDSHVYNEIANCSSIVNDLASLTALDHNYRQSKQRNITYSQYIKAFKNKSIKVFISASAIYIKHLLKK